MRLVDVCIVGAGPAGLATARELARRGVKYELIERGSDAGETWANLYDSLVLHTGKHLSTLPGRRFPRGTPLFVSRQQFVDYLRAYAREAGLFVRTRTEVTRAERNRGSDNGGDGAWRVTCRTTDGEQTLIARELVMATGIVANPRVPVVEGRDAFESAGGRMLHSVEYRRPDEFLGKRVLVVGVGNSGGEIASELAGAAEQRGVPTPVTIAVRSGAHVVPREIAGIPVQYLARAIRLLPRPLRDAIVRAIARARERKRGAPVLPLPAHGPLDAIPLIGFHLDDAIRHGAVQVRGALRGLTRGAARFDDGDVPVDVVILATGFAPALDSLGNGVRRDAKGFALRVDRVQSADDAHLWFVGHNYDASGGLFNIARDARTVARRIASRVRGRSTA